MCSGANRKIALFNGVEIEFKKANPKDIGFKHHISTMLVQAIRALGKRRIDENVVKKIRLKIDPTMRSKILKDTQNTTSWIYEVIKEICKDEE